MVVVGGDNQGAMGEQIAKAVSLLADNTKAGSLKAVSQKVVILEAVSQKVANTIYPDWVVGGAGRLCHLRHGSDCQWEGSNVGRTRKCPSIADGTRKPWGGIRGKGCT